MTTVILRLSAPLQSWGVASRFGHRDTSARPSKSGVIGLVANALGRDRNDSIDDLAALRFGVRTERAGQVITDFHTAQPVTEKTSKLTYRDYLADAAFLAVLEGEPELIEQIAAALMAPARPLYLGRRTCAPDLPVLVGTSEQTLEEVLEGHEPVVERLDDFRPWHRDARAGETSTSMPDHPLSYTLLSRRHTHRLVTSGALAVPKADTDYFDALEG